jgi:hypothetical protein
MERKILALGLCCWASLGASMATAAQRPCAPHEKMADALEAQYGEAAHMMGLAQDDTVMELYAAPQTGTWTLAVTMPNGVTCLIASGKNFEAIAPTQVKGDPT